MSTLPQYSRELRDAFSKINPFHFSCLYKETFEKHAMQILHGEDCSFSLGDRSKRNEWTKESDSEFDREDSEAFGRQDNDVPSGFTDRFYHMMHTQQLGHDNNALVDPSMEFSPWEVCSTNHEYELFDGHLNSKTSSKLYQDDIPKFSAKYFSKTKDRTRVQSPTAFLSTEPRALSYSPFSSSSDRGWSPRVQKEKHALIKELKRTHSPVKCNSEGANFSNYRDKNISKNRGTRKGSPICYEFRHFKNTTGHIQTYREQYTRNNLQHALLQCAHRYYATKSDKNKYISNATFEGADFRNAGKMNKPAEQPTVKISNYTFEMSGEFRTMPIVYLKNVGGGNINAEPDIDECVLLDDDNESVAPSITSELDGVGGGLSVTGVSLTDLSEGSHAAETKKKPDVSIVAVVSRSRPSIPSNSRGIIVPSAVATPIHAISCIKGQSQNLKNRRRSFGKSARECSQRKCTSAHATKLT